MTTAMLGEVKTEPAEWDGRFMRQALEVATWSKDPEVKVGAIVVSQDKRRVSWGYNGFPRGVHDTKDRLKGSERVPLTAHAELNTILNAGCDLSGWTLFVTRPPCLECAKAIIQARISRVVCMPLPEGSSWAEACKQAAGLLREVGIVYNTLKFAEEA